jgi:hypothetical protein
MPLEVEVFGEYVIACRNGRCLWLLPNQSIEYYIERLGLINATCEDAMELSNYLGTNQLVSAYCTPGPIPITAPNQQAQFARQGLVIKLPLTRDVKELTSLVERHCQATVVGDSLVVTGPLTRECLASLVVLLTVMNGALSLVLDGRVVSIGRGRVCVVDDDNCIKVSNCDYELVYWLRRLGLGLPSAVLVCGLVVLINAPTAGASDQDVPKEPEPNQGK